MRRLLLSSKCVLISLLVGCLLAGCAGGGPGVAGGTGRLEVKVNWSQARVGGKLIPASTQCVKLEIFAYEPPASSPGKGEQSPFDTVLVPRQAGDTTTTTLTVPVGDYYIVASAHATEDASDFAQAVGTTDPLTVELNGTANCSLTMAGTVAAIELSPTYLMLNGRIGEDHTITVTATDGSGNVVMLSPGAGVWNTDPPDQITINAAGYVTPLVSSGYVQVSYTDSEQGVTSNEVTVSMYPG